MNAFSFLKGILIVLYLIVLSRSSDGHDGRRFEVGVINGKLVAQGVNSGPNDGAPDVRPYVNAIHDHWRNSPLGLDAASATLPGIDVPEPSPLLVNQPLFLTLEGVSEWVAPPLMPPAGTIPQLTPLPSVQLVELTIGPQKINSEDLGTLILTPSVSPLGDFDIDLLYEVNTRPSDVIHVLTAKLSSGNPLVSDSDPVYILLSPDGTSSTERLHHASLFLEQAVETAIVVPEAGCGALLQAAFGTLLLQRWFVRRRN